MIRAGNDQMLNQGVVFRTKSDEPLAKFRDVIVALEGAPVADVTALLRQASTRAPGHRTRLGILRNQKPATLTLNP